MHYDLPPVLSRAMRLPLLSREEEADLIARAQAGDASARERVVTGHLRLVVKYALMMSNAYHSIGMTDDLIGEGMLCLPAVVDRFDPSVGARFSTFAGWWLRSVMQMYILRNHRLVKLGTTVAQKSMFFNVYRAKRDLEADGSLSPAQVEERLAESFGTTVRDVRDVLVRLSGGAEVSLSHRVSPSEGTELGELLRDEAELPDELAERVLDGEGEAERLREALDALLPRERHVILARYDVDGKTTLNDLAVHHGVSRERIRQIESNALRKLRAALLPRDAVKSPAYPEDDHGDDPAQLGAATQATAGRARSARRRRVRARDDARRQHA